MPDSVQISLCPPATFLLQPCAGIMWMNNSCGYDALCSLHHHANMHFNPTPIQSFLMSSGTDPFASIPGWVQSEGQTVQH